MTPRLAVIAVIIGLAALVIRVEAGTGSRRDHVSRLTPHVVSPSGPYTSIAAALAEAETGDTIEVRGGVYPALIVEKPVTLIGVDWPVIDGGGDGTVVTLAAPDTVLRGFEVRGSGSEPDRDHSGITVTAPRVTVEGNRLHDVLFGVYVAAADDVAVRGNTITSKTTLEEARRGDGVRLWYSRRALIEHNIVHAARDVVVWYSTAVAIRDNVIERGRYGVHLMYADEAVVERNRVLNNSVGVYVMYSKNVRLAENEVRGQRGPSGYAIGFKDADDVTVTGNVLVDNRGGLFIDAAPFSPQGYAHFRDNVLAFNDVGAILLTSVRRAEFSGNTFWENVEQVAIQGGGDLSTVNEWRGNFWSDYAGFDAQGDGVGDVPYRAERFFEGLTDREPLLRALIYSPAAQALEFAGAALPIFRPQPKLEDAAPRLQPASLPATPAARAPSSIPMLLSALALLSSAAVLGGLIVKHKSTAERASASPGGRGVAGEGEITISIKRVSKRYGKAAVLEGVSFTAQPGEAIALWGANGAGKTTLLKAILGLVDFDGAIEVCGCDVARSGKAARRHIGYVPQDVAFYEQSVRETLEFFARLKTERIRGAESSPILPSPSARITELMTDLGLAEHAHKNVSALSGGLRQRLALAVALLADPPVLLLDEPTANLDAQAQRDYLALLHQLRAEAGKTIVFASHRLEEVELLANRVAVLEHGRLVEVVTPEALLTQLMPYIKLTLWVPEAHRADALARFTGAGLNAHLNGRGTVIVQVRAEQKMQLLALMRELPVTDFEMERGRPWN